MTPEEIAAVLDEVAARLEAGDQVDLGSVGFWRAVAAVKRNPHLVERFADRIGAVEAAAFSTWAPLRIPLALGTTVAVVGALGGAALIGAASATETPWNGALVVAGTLLLLVTTHGLGHLACGTALGIRFTGWFLRRERPQPGVKIEYASYLRAAPRSRAWMHAAGALVTKVVPVAVLPGALAAGAPSWTVFFLIGLAVGQVITDVVFSVRSSDWKRFRRELRYARAVDR